MQGLLLEFYNFEGIQGKISDNIKGANLYFQVWSLKKFLIPTWLFRESAHQFLFVDALLNFWYSSLSQETRFWEESIIY